MSNNILICIGLSRFQRSDPEDTRELLNYRDAFEYVSAYLSDGGPVTERLILEIHRRLVGGVRGGSAAPGEYRLVQNYIVNSATGETIYTPPPPQAVPEMMRELVGWLNRPTDIHPVIVSAIAQFQLVHIHPFLDGNGRASRLLSTLLLYKAGYDFKRLFSISEYYDRDRLSFYGAFQGVRRSNMDMTGWVEYFAVGLATQLNEVKQRGESAIRQDVFSRLHALTDRQAQALGYILENGRMTISEFPVPVPQGIAPDSSAGHQNANRKGSHPSSGPDDGRGIYIGGRAFLNLRQSCDKTCDNRR